MPDVPTEDYYSLNQTADFANMERQDFRKLIGEFERQACKLPTRVNVAGQEGKYVPLAFVHIFEEAAIWMRVRDTTHAEAMARALGNQRSDALQHLAVAVRDREPLLRLPQELKEQTKALLKISQQERTVKVDLEKHAEIIQLIYKLTMDARLNVWIILILMFGASGTTAILCDHRTDAQVYALRQQINQSTYVLSKRLERVQTHQAWR